jgi:hypothetical protein
MSQPTPELRRWAVQLIKTRFLAYKSPPCELPADSVIEEVALAILSARPDAQGETMTDREFSDELFSGQLWRVEDLGGGRQKILNGKLAGSIINVSALKENVTPARELK